MWYVIDYNCRTVWHSTLYYVICKSRAGMNESAPPPTPTVCTLNEGKIRTAEEDVVGKDKEYEMQFPRYFFPRKSFRPHIIQYFIIRISIPISLIHCSRTLSNIQTQTTYTLSALTLTASRSGILITPFITFLQAEMSSNEPPYLIKDKTVCAFLMNTKHCLINKYKTRDAKRETATYVKSIVPFVTLTYMPQGRTPTENLRYEKCSTNYISLIWQLYLEVETIHFIIGQRIILRLV